jgi:hypothetical protein
MKHTILTRMRFTDKELMKKYLVLTKDTLVPSLKSQTNQNFVWLLMVRKEDEDFLRSEIDFPFVAIYDEPGNVKYVTENNVEIQTRHDCDDFMFPHYIDSIQKLYTENIDKFSTFLVQSQPTQLMYHTGDVNSIGAYHDKRTSMHLSLCQKTAKYNIHHLGHGQMWQIAEKVINMGEGFTQWVIHGDNISCKSDAYQKAIKKINGK